MPQEYKYNNTASATTLALKNSSTGELVSWSLLDAFGGIPAISVEDFQLLPQSQKLKRKEEFLYHLGGLHSARIIEVNDFIIQSDECSPDDTEYIFEVDLTEHTFGVTGGTIDITVVSTANDKPAPYSFVWDGGETGDNDIQIVQTSGGLRVTMSDTPLAITGVITLTQERIQADNGVIYMNVSKSGATLYAGGTAEATPPQSEWGVMHLSTVEPVYEASPFVLHNPGKGAVFEFTAPLGTITVCIVVPAALGAPQKVMSTTPQYEMTALFELSSVQVVVGEVLCNVYYVTSPVPYAGTKNFEVII